MPCIFRSTGWGVQRLTTGEITVEMDLTPGSIVETFSREAEKIKVMLTYFLRLTPFKALQFTLSVGLGIGSTVITSQKNNGIIPLPPIYTLRDENLFRLNLQVRQTKAVKAYYAEVETNIWNDAAEGVFQGGYMAKRHETLFQNLRNITDKRFNHNVARSFVNDMVEDYGP